MAIPRGIAFHTVEREPEMLPFIAPLLQYWMDLDFEPRACRRALENLFSRPQSCASETLLRPAAITEGAVVATDALLFPTADWSLRIVGQRSNAPRPWQARVPFKPESAREIAEVLRLLGHPSELPEKVGWLGPHILGELMRPEESSEPEFPPIEAPGIYRREHGCAVIRSKTTTLMLDPVSLWIPHAPRAPISVEGGPDAIFITHGHGDHWNLASILVHAKSPNTLVVVPQVSRPSILSPNDMAGTLRIFGQRAVAPVWGSSLVVGDIQVDILPFYGEQPVRNGEGPDPSLRNWGNCYRFRTPEFSALALIDSGVDPAGNTTDVARISRQQHGPVDFVLSSLPRFHCPFFFGLPHYYLTLPFERLRALYHQYRRGELPSVTPGPEGVFEVCAAAGARYYLPYGNGFDGMGQPIRDVGIGMGEPAEADAIHRLSGFFERHGIGTVPIAWNPGDSVSLEHGCLVRRDWSSSLKF